MSSNILYSTADPRIHDNDDNNDQHDYDDPGLRHIWLRSLKMER